ncbi:MAG: methylated-DNA--[protein]-cysteine S-methyltransferase [Cyclobacteriaceae bacterium]|nr:methylated-DNA--[protein]-cysteine S-methyltransferase [Cyclobacteriaceae bacterium]
MQLSLLPDETTMYNALVKKDDHFEGIFYAAIKTTGIFCRPTCTARKPKKENVEYFSSPKDALAYGYRPCKICTPLENKGETPEWIKTLLDEITANPQLRLKDYDLIERGIDPARIRRWFKKHHNMTFQAYLRALRINNAFGQIKHGEKVTNSAFDHGFNSLSGFADSFKNLTGFSPSDSTLNSIITITRIVTPLGPMIAGATDEGVCLLEFTDRRMLETQIVRLKKYLKAEFVPGIHPLFDELEKQLKAYFNGELKEFTIPLVTLGSDFQKKVWSILSEIPYGATRSYKQQADAYGNPKAIRAIAKANGDNRIAIIIPCHRVIGANGEMVGYGGGVWRKQWMLQLELKNK